MPSDLMFSQSAFPNLTAEQSTDEKIRVILNYQYMLLEQLRYSFRNIGADNFNERELIVLGEEIREPVVEQVNEVGERVDTAEQTIVTVSQNVDGIQTRVSTAETNISTLTQTAGAITARVSDAETNISTLTQTAAGIQTRVSDAETNISTLTQTAGAITTRVSDAETNISTLTQTASGISTRVSDAETNISQLTQTAAGLRTDVNSAAGAASTAQQTAESITLSVTNSGTSSTIKLMRGQTQVTSQNITMTGLVKFTDLSTAGSTTIVGDNITSGTIRGVTLWSENSDHLYTKTEDGTVWFGRNTAQGGVYGKVACTAEYDPITGVTSYPLTVHSTTEVTVASETYVYIQAVAGVAIGNYSTQHRYGLTPRIDIGHEAYQADDTPPTDLYLWGNVYVNGVLIS